MGPPVRGQSGQAAAGQPARRHPRVMPFGTLHHGRTSRIAPKVATAPRVSPIRPRGVLLRRAPIKRTACHRGETRKRAGCEISRPLQKSKMSTMRWNTRLMTGILILSAGLVLGGVVVWIALLLWAAREDGRDQERRDQKRDDRDEAPENRPRRRSLVQRQRRRLPDEGAGAEVSASVGGGHRPRVCAVCCCRNGHAGRVRDTRAWPGLPARQAPRPAVCAQGAGAASATGALARFSRQVPHREPGRARRLPSRRPRPHPARLEQRVDLAAALGVTVTRRGCRTGT